MTDLSHILTFEIEARQARDLVLEAIDELKNDLSDLRGQIALDAQTMIEAANRHKKLAAALFDDNTSAKVVVVNDVTLRVGPDYIRAAAQEEMERSLKIVAEGLTDMRDWVISIEKLQAEYVRLIIDDGPEDETPPT